MKERTKWNKNQCAIDDNTHIHTHNNNSNETQPNEALAVTASINQDVTRKRHQWEIHATIISSICDRVEIA